MNKGFTTQEQEELTKASNALNLDADTKKIAFSYFLEYKQKIKQATIERPSLIICCAILAAAKSQVITTVTGDTIRGVGISISQLLRGLDMANKPASIDEFLMSLREFITVVTLSPELSVELKGIIDKFAFSYTFFIKVNALFRQLELDLPMTEHEEYLRSVRNFTWLVFVNSRASILQNRTELVESVFLVAAILNHTVYNLPAEIPLTYFEKIGKNIIAPNTNKKDEEAILAGILELFKLNASSAEDVVAHQKLLQEFLKKLIDGGVLKNTTTGFEGLYTAQNIDTNLEKLDAYYQKKLGFDDLDERFFVRDRKALHAGMFTPFAKQGAANKLNININITKNGDFTPHSMKKSFPVPKMLNYDVTEQVSMKSNLNEIKFAGNGVPQSPFTKIPPATPVSRALEMYNWLSDKVKLKKNPSGLTPGMENYLSVFENKFKDDILNRSNNLVEKVLNYEKENAAKANNPLNEKKVKDKHNQMVSLYLKVLEELLSQEEKKTRNPNYFELLSNEVFHKALIACSIETVFFVNNSSNVNFNVLLELCEIQAFEFWRIIGSFAKFDPQIPFPIKKHLHTIELKIIMCLAWKKGSVVQKIVRKFIDESQNETAADVESPHNAIENGSPDSQSSPQEANGVSTPQKSTSNSGIHSQSTPEKQSKTELTHSQELFFKRVLHHTALHIYQLAEALHVSEKTAEQIWNVMKYILSSETTLLIDRHIDQLVLSTIYGVCKVLHHPLKFQEIITKYQELPSFDKADFIENIHQVYINEIERADLIKFYNSVYISQMKTYLFSLAPQPGQPQMRPGTPQIKKPLVPALVMDSPLRESLPVQIAQYKSISAHAKTNTPLPKYGMTPRTGALYAFGESPCRTLETINNFASKRQINFDDAPDNSNAAGDVIVKKAKSSNPILDKIMEQREEDGEDVNKLPASKRTLFDSDDSQPAPAATGLNRFSSYDETDAKAPISGVARNIFATANPAAALTKVPSFLQTSNMFSQPASAPTKMSLETDSNSESPQQSQTSPTVKPEAVGFQKVQKKDGSITPEFKK